MHADAGWIRNSRHRINPTSNRVSVRNTPRHVRDQTPVAVAGEVATQAADAIGDSQGRSGNIRADEPWNFIFPDNPRYRHGATKQSAVPGKSGTGKNVA